MKGRFTMKREEVFKILKDAIEFVVPEINVEEVTMNDSLKELGANSIDRSEIIYTTMEDANVKLPMVSFNDAKNIGDIIDIIAGALN